MKRVGANVTIALAFAAFVTICAAACDDEQTHIFYGQAYDPTHDCLDTVTAVDTIGGADTGQSCALVCIASPPDPDAAADSEVVYASTTCPPYPPLFDSSGSNPLCVPALAAAKRQSTCLPDGGISDPYLDSGLVDSAVVDSGIGDGSTD
jgi:hypothetical protein